MQKESQRKLFKIIFTLFASCLVLFAFFGKADPLVILFDMFLFGLLGWNIASFITELPKAKSRSGLWGLFKKYTNLRFDRRLALFSALITIPLALLIWWYFGFQPPQLSLQVALFFFFISVFFAPVYEEYMFRKLFLDDALLRIFKELPPLHKNSWLALFWLAFVLLFQSIMFAYLHEDINSWFAFWSRFAVGLLCGILYIKSDRNLLAAISVHATYNLMSSTAILLKILV